MLLSMTGYGSDVYSTDNYTIETEIKSLNSRYLDLTVRLPKELSQHEFAVRDLIKSKIIRGKITVSINLSYNNSTSENYSLNEVDLKNTVSLLENVKSKLSTDERVTINQILQFKDNFLTLAENDSEINLELFLSSLGKAIDNLIIMRNEEGAHLKEDIEFRISNVENLLNKIEELAQNSTQEYFDKFRERAKKLYDEFVDDENRFLIELGILSEKHDVTEECIRLRSHFKLFNESISKSEDIGRKLNFICQEMNREVNTINSKSISSEISHLGINIKEELEKIREQVQNIE